MNFTAVIGFICGALVLITAITSCTAHPGTDGVKAVAEACAALGKEPYVSFSANSNKMGCAPQPASSSVR